MVKRLDVLMPMTLSRYCHDGLFIHILVCEQLADYLQPTALSVKGDEMCGQPPPLPTSKVLSSTSASC